jgi:hypothetical protein
VTHIRLNVTVCAQHFVYVATHIHLNVTVCAQQSVYVATHFRLNVTACAQHSVFTLRPSEKKSETSICEVRTAAVREVKYNAGFPSELLIFFLFVHCPVFCKLRKSTFQKTGSLHVLK